MWQSMSPEQARHDRIISGYLRARDALDTAARAIKAPLPHNPGTIRVLKKAQAELNWYLTELEKRP
ncbi:hypothetical protein ACFY4C_21060 [Actinomadura viridis]|uniref:hypothetical protein n=1 Tax=Actinomadura viridis TaxID=58110 RepID=UPI0036ACCAB0